MRRPAGRVATVDGVTEGTRPDLTGPSTRQALTTPRAAAFAGIAFAVLLGTSIILLRLSLPSQPSASAGVTAAQSGAVRLALNLVPYAGIAFLWFIGVVRDRIGEFEDRFFATVFLGSGLIFLATLFSASAVAGALVAGAAAGPIGSDVWSITRATTFTVLDVYATKMAGVFMVSTATIALRTRILPRWLAVFGLCIALVLVILGGRIRWTDIAFPAWVLLVSIYILRAGIRPAANGGPTRATGRL
jgi:hypothetical protein